MNTPPVINDNDDAFGAVIGTIPDKREGIDAIVDLATTAADPVFVAVDSTDIALVFPPAPGLAEPRVLDLQVLRDKHRHPLDRKQGRYTVTDVDSFLAYYGKHAETDAEIWVSSTGAKAVLNAYTGMEDDNGWRPEDHVLNLQLTHSPEWLRWAAASGKMFKQSDFAEWLEGAARDIVEPDFATVLEVAQSLEATAKVEFKSAYRTADGQRGFRYEETTTAKAGQKGDLEIPASFTVMLRPYIGQEAGLVIARFRYRIQSDALTLGIVVDRVPEILENAVTDIRDRIAAGIDRGIVLSA